MRRTVVEYLLLLPKPKAAHTRPCRTVLKHTKHIVSDKVKIQENQCNMCTEFKFESMMYLSMSSQYVLHFVHCIYYEDICTCTKEKKEYMYTRYT